MKDINTKSLLSTDPSERTTKGYVQPEGKRIKPTGRNGIQETRASKEIGNRVGKSMSINS